MSRSFLPRISQAVLAFLAVDILTLSQSYAALDKNLAVKFYKSPRSLFASGETNRRDLQKNWIKDYSDFSYLVQRENRKFWVKSASVARDLQLSRLVFSSRTKKNYRVLQTAGASIYGQPDVGPAEWLPLSELSPLPQDTGVVMTLTNTQLRENPNWKSDSLLSLPPASRLTLHEVDDTWAKVTFESVGRVTGWVDLSNLIFKHDFAAFALTADRKWQAVQHREGHYMVTKENTKIPLNQITGLMTRPELGISLVTSDGENLLLRQNLTLLQTEFQVWGLSKLGDHGEVFWKKDFRRPASEALYSQSGISIDDILKREVVSVSVHPTNPNMAIVAAQGIFITKDGKNWSQVSQFGNQNFPVLVDAANHFYVGPQRSTDGGKMFSAFFRWENLAHLVEKKQKSPAQQLRVKNLSSPRPGILRLELETPKGSMTVATRTNQGPISKWDFD